jgi:hypothetical protein
MPQILAYLVVAALMVWALVEVAQTPRGRARILPKAAWVVLIVVLAPFGSLAWFWFGRSRTPGPVPTPVGYRSGPLRGRGATVNRPAPDDDPEFLALLNARADQQRRLRRLEEDAGPTEPGGEPDTDRPPRD